tara:strand:+ start:733 stop:1110 length:378 start_codon:yes stop_codon:yes gene_type:complete
MTNNNPDEQRQFSRIPFDATAQIHDLAGQYHAKCTVIDLSLKGILITKPKGWQGHLTEQLSIALMLSQTPIIIKMTASVAHIDADRIGLLCEHIDLESLSHLKRLIELNLGDDALLHRELSALLH